MLFNFILSVGFFMFIERKVLGLGHLREGPNKVFIKGYFQFLFDIIKLFLKNLVELGYYYKLFYFFIPLILFLNIFVFWIFLPIYRIIFNLIIRIIYLIILMVVKIYFLIVMVYFIYSIYSFYSMVRMIIQIISYDIIIILVFLFNFFLYLNFDFFIFIFNFFHYRFFVNLFIFVFWFVSVIVELIRLPFDFYEGESELVSGFNVEYGSLFFLILVLIEYIEIIYFMVLTVIMFVYSFFYGLLFNFFLFFFVYLIIWIRVFFVRYRLDKILVLLWRFIFPFIIIFLFFYYYVNFM